MAYPDSIIYTCSEEGINPIAYHDTEHYQITRQLLVNSEPMLQALLDD